MLNHIFAFLFPDIKKCISCHREVKGNLPICNECEHDITYYIDYNICNKCGRFYHGPVCESTMEIMAVARYEEHWKEIIHKFKFNNHQYLAKGLAEKMKLRLEKDPFKLDIITYIPASKKTMKKRGYDQSELLAKELGRLINKPVVSTLNKKGNRSSQHTLSLIERAKNWEGEFALKPNLQISNKKILLVDDIFTTGNTLYFGMETLKQSGCGTIKSLVLAN